MKSIMKKKCIVFDIEANRKNEVILTLIKKLKEENDITDIDKFYQDVLAREKLAPTYIGYNIGLPHGRTENVLNPAICFGRLKEEVLWNEDTCETVNMVILIAVPGDDKDNTHMKILSRLARRLMHEEFIKGLKSSGQEEVFNLLKEGLGE